MLFSSISSMFGGHRGGSAFGDTSSSSAAAASPWDNNSGSSASGGDLARDAGLNDVGNSNAGGNPSSTGLFGDANDLDTTDVADLGDDFDGGDFGGSDNA
jgi:hypothetical protein